MGEKVGGRVIPKTCLCVLDVIKDRGMRKLTYVEKRFEFGMRMVRMEFGGRYHIRDVWARNSNFVYF